ncbi:hypothetical protein GWI33_019072 [Rhynchophorus ferrugineus]|uniref:Uncharacterized protein n=1 Tax=Rhynchophorus ferrugineus TaxID=354439 RepID=A0A834HTI0_RHYFE|nr:hypothetical protein GWI33_019072 [Rhynchophorus ferrugineus]
MANEYNYRPGTLLAENSLAESRVERATSMAGRWLVKRSGICNKKIASLHPALWWYAEIIYEATRWPLCECGSRLNWVDAVGFFLDDADTGCRIIYRRTDGDEKKSSRQPEISRRLGAQPHETTARSRMRELPGKRSRKQTARRGGGTSVLRSHWPRLPLPGGVTQCASMERRALLVF